MGIEFGPHRIQPDVLKRRDLLHGQTVVEYEKSRITFKGGALDLLRIEVVPGPDQLGPSQQ